MHADNAHSALSRLASSATQTEGALPWEVTCRCVVDGIALLLHMTQRAGWHHMDEAIRARCGRRGAMNPDEYYRRFADAIIEQIRSGTAPQQKP